MAITSSAKKAVRSSARKRLFNLRRRAAIQKVQRRVKKLIAEKKFSEAAGLVPAFYKALDKAAKAHFIKKNKAARQKSRFVALIRRSSASSSR